MFTFQQAPSRADTTPKGQTLIITNILKHNNIVCLCMYLFSSVRVRKYVSYNDDERRHNFPRNYFTEFCWIKRLLNFIRKKFVEYAHYSLNKGCKINKHNMGELLEWKVTM
jgi:hypothetical protein